MRLLESVIANKVLMFVFVPSKHAVHDAGGYRCNMACKEGLLFPACCCPLPGWQAASCLRIALCML
jgi:hypothetical protein